MSGRADYLELGDWNAVCYQCGRKRKASALLRHWQGYYVCPEHWEARQPQDFVRAINDVQTPEWVQPMPADSFVFGGVPLASVVGSGSGTTDTGVLVPGNADPSAGLLVPDYFIPAVTTPAAAPGFTSDAIVAAGGSGYTLGDTLALVGGTLVSGSATSVTVTDVTGGAVTAVTVDTVGNYVAGSEPPCAYTDAWTGTLSTYSVHIALSSGNLTATKDSTAYYSSVPSSVTPTGTSAAYVRFTVTAIGSGAAFGIASNVSVMADGALLGANGLSYGYLADGTKGYNGTYSAYGATYTTGDVIGMYLDESAGTLTFYKNGVSQGVAFSGITGIGTWFAVVNINADGVVTADFSSGLSGLCGATTTGGTGTGAQVTVPAVTTVAVGNYDPAAKSSSVILYNNNAVAETNNSALGANDVGTVYSVNSATTGIGALKRYCEFQLMGVITGNFFMGISSTHSAGLDAYIGSLSGQYSYSQYGYSYAAAVRADYGPMLANTISTDPLIYPTIGMLFDAAAGTLSFTVNGVDQGVAYSGISGTFWAGVSLSQGQFSFANFGMQAWRYTPPDGYQGWTAAV